MREKPVTSVSSCNPYESPRIPQDKNQNTSEPSPPKRDWSVTTVLMIFAVALANAIYGFAYIDNTLHLRDSFYGVIPMPPTWVTNLTCYSMPVTALAACIALAVQWRRIPPWMWIGILPSMILIGDITLHCVSQIVRTHW